MAGELYFNGNQWRKAGYNEQQVRFLELLWQRIGGGPVPDFDLGEVGTEINNIYGEATPDSSSAINKLEKKINDLQDSEESRLSSFVSKLAGNINTLDDQPSVSAAAYKKLESKVNSLESQLSTTMSTIRKLERKINELESV